MKNKLIIGLFTGAVAVAVLVFLYSTSDNGIPGISSANVYCSAYGTLTSERPIQSHRSYCIKVSGEASNYDPNAPYVFAYSIVDDEGNVLKEFETAHEKIMHFIVVRKDLANFAHVHPEFNATTGEFTLVDLTFPFDGEYRLFADFTPTTSQIGSDGARLPVTVYHDVEVGNLDNYKPQSLGDSTSIKTVDDYQVALSSDAALVTGKESLLMFAIGQAGQPVTDLEQYLGSLGHAVILREGDFQFIHTHPVDDPMASQTGYAHFMVSFAEAGKYKVFMQFQHQGKIMTSDFIVNVAQGEDSSNEMEGMDMPGMNH